jgi:hypothetical protein
VAAIMQASGDSGESPGGDRDAIQSNEPVYAGSCVGYAHPMPCVISRSSHDEE